MNVQVIEKDKKPEWAVLPYELYLQLVEDAEMLQDILDYDEAKKAIEAGEELVPAEIPFAIMDGANPVKVWREYRGLTQQQLADAAGISASYLSQIETGQRTGSVNVLSAIATALRLDLKDKRPFTPPPPLPQSSPTARPLPPCHPAGNKSPRQSHRPPCGWCVPSSSLLA
jgi:DNA-binding XRE family transcriptional regulator